MSTIERARRGSQRVGGVTYDAYVRVRDDRRNQHLRMAYHDGVLEFMPPDFRHDNASRRLSNVILAYTAAFDIPCEPAGATTFGTGVPGSLLGKGRKADESFYIGDVVREIVGRDRLDLSVDPPPTLWVEVDHWGSSRSKLPLHAGLGVPEWHVAPVEPRRVSAARDGRPGPGRAPGSTRSMRRGNAGCPAPVAASMIGHTPAPVVGADRRRNRRARSARGSRGGSTPEAETTSWRSLATRFPSPGLPGFPTSSPSRCCWPR